MMCASWRWISTGADKPLMAVSGPSGDRHLEKFRRAAKLIEHAGFSDWSQSGGEQARPAADLLGVQVFIAS
jgi:hypothetical protein